MIKSVGIAAFLAGFTLGSAFPVRGDPPGQGSATASPAVQERGQSLLKELVEVNRYWLLATPETVTNYGYVFHLLWDEPSQQQTGVRVTDPAKARQPRRHGVTYYSVLQGLARDPKRALVREVTEQQGKITVILALLPPAAQGGEGQNPVTGVAPNPLTAESPFQGECGNGVRGAFRGYFSFAGAEARLVLDAKRMVPLEASVRRPKSSEWTEETFSDYAEVSPRYFAPLSVTVNSGEMEFKWKFKLHEGGLWLLDQSMFEGQKVAWLEQVAVNRPISELPAEPPPAARKAKRPAEYRNLTTNSVEVAYAGISPAYARAIAQVVSVARATAQDQFGFNMPRLITITVTAEPGGRVQLFNDGQDHFVLDVRSEAGLERPERTGTFQIYGLCHEVGHLAMYRVGNFDWMKGDAKEAWAHYLGSRLTDVVYEKCGPGVWPDRYDYRADGMQRLEKQLASAANPSPYDRAVRAWKELVELVGDKGVTPLFAAWAKARTDSLNPGAAIQQALAGQRGGERLIAWWTKSEPALVQTVERSAFPAQQVEAAALAQQSVELALDDGQSAGKRSIAGSGHAVRFQAKEPDCVLTQVRMFGLRYGMPTPPEENFHVWLCDKEFKPIADFPFPYASFPYAEQ
jgi:hypothetical protein